MGAAPAGEEPITMESKALVAPRLSSRPTTLVERNLKELHADTAVLALGAAYVSRAEPIERQHECKRL